MAAGKTKEPPPSSDGVRRNVLSWFFLLNKKGGAARGMQDLCKGIKDEFGYKAPLVKEHLTFLCDLDYVKKETVMTKVKTGQTEREQAKSTYRIGAKGIEFMEGKSAFSDKDRYPGINITATGSTVVLGDGNVVNSNNRETYDELGKLLHAIADSLELNDASKLEASVNVETIRDQLALNQPNQTIIEAAWQAASKLCTTATLVEYVTRIAPMIGGLF